MLFVSQCSALQRYRLRWGVVSLQSVTLIPLGEADAMPGAFRRTALYETPDVEALQPGGLRREDIGNENGTLTGGTR